MLTKRVVKVQLTYITETEAEHLTSYVGTPLWRVEWVETTTNGKTCTMSTRTTPRRPHAST